MVTLGRFKALADSYGADLRHWPDDLRADAEALLDLSPEARRYLAEAAVLDQALADVRARERTDDAALARLRAGVAARIAVPARKPFWRLALPWSFQMDFVLLGTATGGGVAIAAGLLLGFSYVATPASGDVLAMLQPAPIPFLAE